MQESSKDIMSEFLYRVCTLNSLEESIERQTNLPGANFSLTGFFHQNFDNAYTLWKRRNDHCILYYGGETWSVIIRVSRASCTLEKNYKKYKDGHDSTLDRNECFVSKVENDAIIEKYENGIWEPIPISIFNKEDTKSEDCILHKR